MLFPARQARISKSDKDNIMKYRINKHFLAATVAVGVIAISSLTGCAPKYGCYGDAGRIIEPAQEIVQPVSVQVERGVIGE
jgi:hypothetical protein